MHRNVAMVVLTLAVVTVFCSAMAQDAANRDYFLAVGVRGLYANVEDAFDESIGARTSVDEEFGYGAMAKLAIGGRLWAQFAVDAFAFTGKYVEPDYTISADFDTIPLTATLLIDLVSRKNTICPYIGAGIGYYLNDLEDVNESAFGFLFDLDEYADFDADNGFGWHVCAGVDWFLSDHLALNFEALYRWVEYDWDVIMRPFGLRELGEDLSGSGSDDLDGWAAIVGLTLFF
ncbi:MAG: outer membrane beta-barrel protein [Acidobacteriota bacterium]